MKQKPPKLERVKGIEPSSQAWEARILPLNHTRLRGEAASARQARLDTLSGLACTGTDNVYQTGGRLATGLHGNQIAASSRLIASRSRFSINVCRSGETTLLPSSSRT